MSLTTQAVPQTQSTGASLRTLKLIRVAILCDLIEEKWHSMDLVAEMLLQNHAEQPDSVQAVRVCPAFISRFQRVPAPKAKRFSFKADRLLNRFWDYPRSLRRMSGEFDLFHIIDHSYSNLIHQLPAGRTIITCHDLDAFRCILEPERDPRSGIFRLMAGHLLSGLRKAAVVACDSQATRSELLAHRVLPPDRLVVVPLGARPRCSPSEEAAADREATRLLGSPEEHGIEILHVGSTIPRKRIDLLLRIFAEVRTQLPRVRLIRAGGPFTASQALLFRELNLTQSIVQMDFVSPAILKALYRRAALVLQPSEAEGFGLPVIESMGCGTPVIATDIPALREVGGEAARYCSLGDVSAWSNSVIHLLWERAEHPELWQRRRSACKDQAANFTWPAYSSRMAEIYREVLQKL